MYGQHMAHIRLLIYCVLFVAVSSFSSSGFMQHMFSPIPHIAPAIEVYLVSDSSYYSTFISAWRTTKLWATDRFLNSYCSIKVSWELVMKTRTLPYLHFRSTEHLNWNHWGSVLCPVALQWWLSSERIFSAAIRAIYKSLQSVFWGLRLVESNTFGGWSCSPTESCLIDISLTKQKQQSHGDGLMILD